MMLQMLPITFKMSISATSWNQIPARLRYFAFLSAYAGSQATVFLPSTVWMSKHDRRRWVFTIPIILGEWASVNVCKSQGHPGYSPKQRAIWCARWLAVFMLIGFPQSDKLESVEVIRRERIYPFRKVDGHLWFVERGMVRQHRRAYGCPPPHRLRFGKFTFHRVLSHLIPFNKTLKNRSVLAGASHPPYGVIQHFTIQRAPHKNVTGRNG